MTEPKLRYEALQRIADIVNAELKGKHHVYVGKMNDKYAGPVVQFDWENGAGEDVIVIFLRYGKEDDNG